jgi:hypothetical protein
LPVGAPEGRSPVAPLGGDPVGAPLGRFPPVGTAIPAALRQASAAAFWNNPPAPGPPAPAPEPDAAPEADELPELADEDADGAVVDEVLEPELQAVSEIVAAASRVPGTSPRRMNVLMNNRPSFVFIAIGP